MKQIRFLCAALVLALLCPILSVGVAAYGSADETLIITHINTTNSTEGSAVILSGSHAEKVGEKGNFAWWTVLIFDWDATQGCFVLTESNTNSNNVDKSDMSIPQYGFAYCICVGNDYSSSGGINYITDRISDSSNYAKSLEIGTKAYLYGTSLYTGTIKTNGKNWYAPDFESDSYIKIGTPVSGETAYDPVASEGEKAQMTVSATHVNSTHYAVGDCILYTPAHGKTVRGGGDFSWWRCMIFDWNPETDCYTVIATDSATGASNAKSPIIPENGFVLLECSSASQSSFDSAEIGMEAYLYKEGDQYLVCLNVPEDGKTPVTLTDISSVKTAPELQELSMETSVKCTPDGYTVEWSEVSGAASYTVAINCSTPSGIGKLILQPTTVNGTSYTVPGGMLAVGNSYTVFVSADNGMNAAGKLYCISEESMNSSLSKKTILAFGDSLTARSGWVNMLGGYLGTEVINAGVGGDTTAAGLARFKKDVLNKQPDIALVCFGMNDQAQVQSSGKPNVSPETYRENMTEIVTELQAIGTDVILIAPHDAYAADGYYTPGSYGLDYAYGNMKDFCDIVRDIAQEYGCGLIDIYAETQNADMSTFLNIGDGIHQSTQGHELWAKYVSEYLLAAYDGKNSATVSVNIETADGEIMEYGTWVMAEGASMYVPVPDVAGLENAEPQLITANGNITVTYTAEGTAPSDTSDSASEEPEPSADSFAPAESNASADVSSDTDGPSALWIVIVSVALLAIVIAAVAVILLRKKA